ncbi:hypothetical protein ACPA9J_27265 [Pseudomonas aeruginosa]
MAGAARSGEEGEADRSRPHRDARLISASRPGYQDYRTGDLVSNWTMATTASISISRDDMLKVRVYRIEERSRVGSTLCWHPSAGYARLRAIVAGGGIGRRSGAFLVPSLMARRSRSSNSSVTAPSNYRAT